MVQSRHSVASRVALDLPCWTMCLASYRLTRMAFTMAHEAGAYFSFSNFMSCITIAKRPCYGPLKIKPSYYCLLICYQLVPILWRPANSNECGFGYHCRRWASDCCNLQRGSTNKLLSPLVYYFILIPSVAASSNPFQRGSWGWGMFLHQNHAAGGENGSSWWGCLCDMCLAGKKPSKWEFFVPVGTHLAVNSLTAIDAHEHQCFNKLRGTVVSRRIIICSQSLIAC